MRKRLKDQDKMILGSIEYALKKQNELISAIRDIDEKLDAIEERLDNIERKLDRIIKM